MKPRILKNLLIGILKCCRTSDTACRSYPGSVYSGQGDPVIQRNDQAACFSGQDANSVEKSYSCAPGPSPCSTSPRYRCIWKTRHRVSEEAGASGCRWRIRENLDLLETFDTLITEAEHEIQRLVKNASRVNLLRTIPGLGLILAVVVALEIDDISRFGAAPRLTAQSL